ncbi:MAG: peroxiredoxin [Bacteroidota bacterium]
MTLIGKKAPIFRAAAVVNGQEVVQDFSLGQFLGKKEIVFFFYPKDFTFVCPTELIAFQDVLGEFEQRNVAVVGCSTDTEETHLAWLNTPRNQGGIQGVTYPLVADTAKTIAQNYGVLGGEWDYDEKENLIFDGVPIAYRATFLIDKQGIIRHALANDFTLGRNIAETLRTIDMWHHVEHVGEVCPANWQEGQEAMQPTREGMVKYMTKQAEESEQ